MKPQIDPVERDFEDIVERDTDIEPQDDLVIKGFEISIVLWEHMKCSSEISFGCV